MGFEQGLVGSASKALLPFWILSLFEHFCVLNVIEIDDIQGESLTIWRIWDMHPSSRTALHSCSLPITLRSI